MHLNAVLAVSVVAPAEAAAERLEVEVLPARRRVATGEDRRGIGTVGRAHNGIRQGVGERADDHVDDALAGIGPRRDGGGRRAIQQGAVRTVDFADGEDALVIGNFRIEQRFQAISDRGLRRVQRDIDVSRYLRGRAGEVEADAVAGHFDPDLDRNVHGAEAVIVHDVFETVGAVRNAGDALAHTLLGALDDFAERGVQRCDGIGLGGLDQPAVPEAAGGNLGVIVAAPFFRNSDIQQQEFEQVFLKLATPEQFDDGNAETFLINLRHAARHRARRHAAHIRMVCDIADERRKRAVDEDGHRHVYVGQMGAARDVRIVCDKEIALFDVLKRIFREELFHQPGHRCQMNGQGILRLDDQAAGDVANRRRVVAALFDVRRIGTLGQCDEGLVGNRTQAVEDDLKSDWVEGWMSGHCANSMMRFKVVSTRARSPG